MTSLIEKYIKYLRYERNYSLHTEISYFEDLSQFRTFLEDHDEEIDVGSVDGDIVRQWIVCLMESEMSARTVNRKLSALKSFYKYLQRIGEVSDSPMKRVVGPKMKRPLPTFVSHADMERVLDESNFDDTFESVRNKTILELFYITGMREAELIGLTDKDVDFSNRTIQVTGKRNKQRLIPLSEKSLNKLRVYLNRRDEEFGACAFPSFFVRRDGAKLHPTLVYKLVHEALEAIPTLAKASPHVLRHSFATNMLNNGADINAVKEILGHASLASTEVYTHTTFEELKKIYDKAHPRAE